MLSTNIFIRKKSTQKNESVFTRHFSTFLQRIDSTTLDFGIRLSTATIFITNFALQRFKPYRCITCSLKNTITAKKRHGYTAYTYRNIRQTIQFYFNNSVHMLLHVLHKNFVTCTRYTTAAEFRTN